LRYLRDSVISTATIGHTANCTVQLFSMQISSIRWYVVGPPAQKVSSIFETTYSVDARWHWLFLTNLTQQKVHERSICNRTTRDTHISLWWVTLNPPEYHSRLTLSGSQVIASVALASLDSNHIATGLLVGSSTTMSQVHSVVSRIYNGLAFAIASSLPVRQQCHEAHS
jgi:hypothetical protein